MLDMPDPKSKSAVPAPKSKTKPSRPKTFSPSPESLSSCERTITNLRYLIKAAELLEQHVESHADVPAWVLERIHIASVNLGMAVSYMRKIDVKSSSPEESS